MNLRRLGIVRRFEAAQIIKELLTTDQYKVKDSLTDDQFDAIQMAFWALENPGMLCCCHRRSKIDLYAGQKLTHA